MLSNLDIRPPKSKYKNAKAQGMLKHAAVVFLFAYFLFVHSRAFGTTDAEIAEDAIHFSILFSTDFFGRFRDVSCSKRKASSDFSNLVATVDAIRKHEEQKGHLEPVILSTGDIIRPHALPRFLLHKGKTGANQLCRWLKKARYDVIGLSEQDFQSVPERLHAYLYAAKEWHLNIVISNVTCEQTAGSLCALMDPNPLGYKKLQRGPVSIAVISVISPSLLARVPAMHLDGLTILDPVSHAKTAAEQARKDGMDLVLVLANLDNAQTTPQAVTEFSKRVPDADLIIANALSSESDGRSVRTIQFADGKGRIVGGSRVGLQLGKVDFVLAPNKKSFRVTKLASHLMNVNQDVSDPHVKRELLVAENAYCRAWGMPVGKRQLEHPMGPDEFSEFLMDVMRVTTKRELAFVHHDLLDRTKIFPLEKVITKHDFFAGIPHRNMLYTFSLPGKDIQHLCGRMALEEKQNSPPKIRSKGLACGDPIKINNRPLNVEDTYSAVTVEYLALGTLGYFNPTASPMTIWNPESKPTPPILGKMARDFLEQPSDTDLSLVPIDSEEGFPNLSRKLRWRFKGDLDFNLSDTTIQNQAHYAESQLVVDELFALRGEARGRAEGSSEVHGVSLDAAMKYAQSRTNRQSFVEIDDLDTMEILYKLNILHSSRPVFWMPVPYLGAKMETEMTRPTDIRDYHHLETSGSLGSRFVFLPDFEGKMGIAARREMLAPKANWIWGLDFGYELGRKTLFHVFESPMQMESVLNGFYGDWGNTDTLKGSWVNRLYLSLVGKLFFNITHDLFFYRHSHQDVAFASQLTVGLSLRSAHSLQTF